MKSDENSSDLKQYPSAEMLKIDCYNDYIRLLDTYDKIYTKVNIALAFSGTVILAMVSKFDYNIIFDLIACKNKSELFVQLLYLFSSVIATCCSFWSLIQLLILLKGKQLVVFNSIDIRNKKIYEKETNNAALWLIDKYTTAVCSLKIIIEKKQNKYDLAISLLVVSIIAYCISIIAQKGI